MSWTITIPKKVIKKLPLLPKLVKNSLAFLIKDIELNGPARGQWPNYGKLGKNRYHCHLKKGHPTYVAVWEVKDKKINLVEVTYVHDKALY